MTKPWDEVAQSSEFLSLPAEEQDAARQQYFREVVAPQFDMAEIPLVKAQFDAETAAPKDGSMLGDSVAAFGIGANSLLGIGGDIVQLATGDKGQNWAQEQSESGREYWQEKKSDELKASEKRKDAKVGQADGVVDEFLVTVGETVKNPLLLATTLSEQVPNLVGMGVFGRAAGAGAKALGAGEAGAGAVATGGAVGAGAAMQGTDVAGDTYRRLMENVPDDVWAEDGDFAALAKLKGPDQAKHEMALSLARAAGAQSAGLSVATNMLPGTRILERALGGAGGKVRGGVVARTGKGVVAEGGQEVVEEGGGRYIGNVAVSEVAPDTDLAGGVGHDAGLGFVGGGVFGGVAGALSPRRDADSNVAAATGQEMGQDTVPGGDKGSQRGAAPHAAINPDAGLNTGQDAPEGRGVVGAYIDELRSKQVAPVASSDQQEVFDEEIDGLAAVLDLLTPGLAESLLERAAIQGASNEEAASVLLGAIREKEQDADAVGERGFLLEQERANAAKVANIAAKIGENRGYGINPDVGMNTSFDAVGRDARYVNEIFRQAKEQGKKAKATAATAADQSIKDNKTTPASTGFAPTHETSDGTQVVAAEEDGVLVGAEGNEIGGRHASRVVEEEAGEQQKKTKANKENKEEAAGAPVAETEIAVAANSAATSKHNDLPEPTDKQKEAGNYKKGRLSINGMEIAIENPAGSKRRTEWPQLVDHYGDFKRTTGAEGNRGEGVDVFVNHRATHEEVKSRDVFVVDQYNSDGSFDEHKVVLGARHKVDAKAIYKRNYEKGWSGGKEVTKFTWGEFKEWLDRGDQGRPAGTRASVAKTAKKQEREAAKTISSGMAPATEQKKRGTLKDRAGIAKTKNKVFTDEAAEKALSVLKGKLGSLSAGLDPEVIQAGITLAGHTIESGARAFFAYSKAMIGMLGDGVSGYLRGWYEAVRHYPGFDSDGMTPADQIDSAESAILDVTGQTKEPENEQTRGASNQKGAAKTEGRRVDAKHGEDRGDNRSVDVGKPKDVPGAGGRGDSPGGSTGGPGKSRADGVGATSVGDASNGRTGAGGKKSFDAVPGKQAQDKPGRRGRGESSGSLLDAKQRGQATDRDNAGRVKHFHIEDPLRIIGGGQVARFNKNKAAIELYNEISSDLRSATDDEKAILAGYTGWGSFGQELFRWTWDRPQPKEKWEERDRWLRDHLGKSQWESAQRSITNSHYTDPPTVLAMWGMIERLGFRGGKVLEPAMGIGNFFGMMPKEMKQNSTLAGIELDELTGGMAKIIYPDANISIKPYQESKTPDGFYDLIIGNWPFENTPVADRRYNKLNPMVHDYFFLKAIDQTRPGGLVVAITSKETLDKVNSAIRIEMAKKAELIAAFRLPSGAFKDYAGTAVVTDIVILKKRDQPQAVVKDRWTRSVGYMTPAGESVNVNEYYHENIDHVIGEIDYGHGTTSARPGLIVHRPKDMAASLSKAVESVPDGAYERDQAKHISYITNHTDDREGALTASDGKLFVVHGEHLAPANEIKRFAVKSKQTTKNREAQLFSLIDLRNAYGKLIYAERKGASDSKAMRAELKKQYERFVKKFGAINESFGLDYLRRINDQFFASLAALEINTGDANAPVWSPSPVLSGRVTRSAINIDNPSISDAFVLARNKFVVPLLKDIAKIAKRPEQEVKKSLISSGAVFESHDGGIIPADVYLSGDVRKKLMEAVDAVGAGRDSLQRNVDALEKVLPEAIPYHKIEVRMGASWVDESIYDEYVAHLLNIDSTDKIKTTYMGGRWKVKLDAALNYSTEASSGYGSKHVKFSRLVNAAISNQSIVIRAKDKSGTSYVVESATKEVAEKIANIRSEFQQWVWRDADRRVKLEEEYNIARNSWATPRYDGSFLRFEGMALSIGDSPLSLRKHQVNAIWRGVVNRKSLNAHEVGTGKTFTIAGLAIESRRYGIAKKPLVLAHNANSATVAAEMQAMYPAAKILYIDNMAKESIAVKMRQIANDDWDAVVVPHSLIDRMALSEETLLGIAAQEIALLEDEARDAAKDDGVTLSDEMLSDEKKLGKLRSATAKELVKQRNRILANIKKQAQRASRDNAIPFEELGVDMILVDEVHEFKKPPITTKMRMKGLNVGVSDKSIALSFLTKYIRANNGGGNVHTFTGTPITNTLTEIFHQMRYVMEEEMEAAGVDQWDGWFGSFASEITDVELNAAAEYETVTRLASFINVPELRKMIGQYMDVVFSDDMPEMRHRKTKSGKSISDDGLSELELAELENGRTEGAKDRPYKRIINDNADLTVAQKAEFEKILGYARKWRGMTGKEKKKAMSNGAPESPIIYEGLAAKASFDVRLVNAEALAGKEGLAQDDKNSKASRAIKNILDIYRSDNRATQVVFSNLGISKKTSRSVGSKGNKRSVSISVFSTIHDMIERLVQAGVAREQIALVSGSTNKKKRAQIAEAMNRSEIRIVFGSTETLGVGVNMQKNLRAMHHMDAPWMPGSLEQRNGRGHRQGNQWNTVLEYRYLTDRLDGRRWQVLAIKQRFITAFLKASGDMRVIEGDAASDEESDILSTFSEAAGDPRILIREKIKKKIDSLESKERLHTFAVADSRKQVLALKQENIRLSARIEELRVVGDAVDAALERSKGDGFSATIGKGRYSTRKTADAAIKKVVAAEARIGRKIPVGRIMGLDAFISWGKYADQPRLVVDVNNGNANEEIGGDVASIQSLVSGMRRVARHLGVSGEKIAKNKKSIVRLEEISKEEFSGKDQLSQQKAALADLERDMEDNPVPPPAWLRQGAPVDTEVFWNGKPFVVSGHRWTDSGWFVVAGDGKGDVTIPYIEVKDGQGVSVYEETKFVKPEVIEKKKEDDGGGDESKFKLNLGRPAGSISSKDIESVIARTSLPLMRSGGIVVVDTFNNLPKQARADAAKQGAGKHDVEGVFHNGSIYLVRDMITSKDHAESLLFHEATHKGIGILFKDAGVKKALNALYLAIGGAKGLNSLAEKLGVNLSSYRHGVTGELPGGGKKYSSETRNAILVDELIAHVGEIKERKITDKIREVVGAIRNWLREKGFVRLSKYGASDIAYLAKSAREAGLSGKSGGGGTRFMVAWHGSGVAGIDEFNTDAIGAGEGAQAYGWGLYFADNRAVAEHYKDQGVRSRGDGSKGGIYKVTLAPKEDEYLLWDKPLSEQSEKVQAAIKGIWDTVYDEGIGRMKSIGGGDFYDDLANRVSPEAASKRLLELGVRGIKYLSGSTRGAKSVQWSDGVSKSRYNKGTLEKAKQYINGASGDVKDAIRSLRKDWRRGSGADRSQLADAARALEGGAIIKNESFNYVIFDDADVKIRARLKRRAADAVQVLQSDFIDNFKSVAKAQSWGALTLRQITEVLADQVPTLRSKYLPIFKQYETDQNMLKEKAGRIAQERRKLKKAVNERLSKLQHEATIAGVDPADDFIELISDVDAAKNKIKLLKQRQLDAPGSRKDKWQKQIKDIEFDLMADKRRMKEYASLRSQWDLLPSDAKAVYIKERDHHSAVSKMTKDALLQRISDMDAPDGFKSAMMDKLRVEFDKNLRSGPYFPLARFGRYWVSSLKDGEQYFDMFESKAAQDRFIRENGNELEITGAGKQLENLQDVDGVNPKFVTEVDSMLQGLGDSPMIQELRDDIYQLYLERLPEMSARKHYIHRKKTKGFHRDQARAFADKALHDANHIARLRHAHRLDDVLSDATGALDAASSKSLRDRLQKQNNALQSILDTDGMTLDQINEQLREINQENNERKVQVGTSDVGEVLERVESRIAKNIKVLDDASTIDNIEFVSNGLNELRKSHIALSNQNTHPIAQRLNALGFAWFLGMTPAAALVNMSQTPVVALPLIGAKYGFSKASSHLATATKDFVSGGFSIKARLNKEEKEAYRVWHDSGLLEETMAHDLAGVADAGINTGTFRARMGTAISYMFHNAERMNREVTALAAYRAARESGVSHELAIDIASELTYKSHFDYSAGNRARFMRGNFARVITQFKQYSQNITYLYAKILRDSFRGATAEERAEAKKALIGMLIGQFSVAGSLGMPMAGVMLGVAQALENAFGDDDDPVNVKAEYRQWLADVVGKDGGQLIAKGFFDTFTPFSISGRLSVADLWVRTSDRDLEGRAEAQEYLNALLGPQAAIFTNMFIAKDLLLDGKYERAIEYSVPKFIKDALRGMRFIEEDALTMSGNKLKEMGAGEIVGQMIGFSPSELSELYEANNAINNITKRRTKRRKDLITRMVNAREEKDSKKIASVQKEISRWNAVHKNDRITFKTIQRSMRSRKRYSESLDHGVRRTKRNADLLERYDFAAIGED